MPLTFEQETLLKLITEKLRNIRQNPDSPKLPALCYALDENILSDDDYELLKDADFSILAAATPSYTAAIVIIFVRNFYERGSGQNPWQCTPVINNVKCKAGFLDAVSHDPNCSKLGFKNPMFPVADADSVAIRPWLLSQCWLLKVHDGSGRTSQILRANAAVYRLFEEQFADVAWEDLLAGSLDEEMDSMELIPCYFRPAEIPSYISYLFEHYRKIYLLSLRAMSMDKDEPYSENTPAWLMKIWGGAYSDIRCSARDLPSMSAYWKIVVNGNLRDLVLSYRLKKFQNVYLHQDDKRIALAIEDQVSLSTLLNKGFDIHQNITLSGETETGGRRNLIVPPLRTDASVFRSSDSGAEERRLLSAYGRISYAPNNRKIYVVSSAALGNFNLTYDGVSVDLETNGRIYGNYMCYSAVLPVTHHPALSPLVVNETHILDLIERPCVNLLNANKSMMLEYDNRRVYVVEGNTLRVYVEGSARVEPEPQHVQVLPARVVECEIPVENMNKIHTITVHRRNNNVKSREVHFICIPDDWKSKCVRLSDEEMHDSAKKGQVVYCYNTEKHGVLKIAVPIDKTYTFWIPKKESDKRASMMHLKSLSDLEGFSKVAAYSNSPVKMEIRKDGKLIKDPEKLSSITVNKIIRILNSLPRFARKQTVVITFNNRPVLSVQI